MISSVSPDGTWLYIHEHLGGELESVRLNMDKVNPLFMAAARAAQHIPKLLEIKLGVEAHKDMDNPLCEMAFAAQGYCSEKGMKGDHAALRLDGFIFLGSKKAAFAFGPTWFVKAAGVSSYAEQMHDR